MPNVLTHGLMAQDVLSTSGFITLSEIIKKYPKAYFLGSSGPDFLFYYNVWPWKDQTNSVRMATIGNRVHAEHINAFYTEAIKVIKAESDPDLRDVMLAFLAGHLTHWSLDTVAHPFIFFHTGEIAGKTKYWHYRMESMIDTLMVKEIKGFMLSSHPTYRFINPDAQTLKAVCALYIPVLKNIFEETVSEEEIFVCLKDAHAVLNLLFDPLTLKFPLIQLFETLASKKWGFSSHMVIGKSDLKNDVLNLNHTEWVHPCDASMKSTHSFPDLYELATLRAQAVLAAFDRSMTEGNNTDDLCELIQNRTYDTGLKNPPEMVNYRPIY